MSTSFKNVTPTGPGGTATLLIVLSFIVSFINTIFICSAFRTSCCSYYIRQRSGGSRKPGLNLKSLLFGQCFLLTCDPSNLKGLVTKDLQVIRATATVKYSVKPNEAGRIFATIASRNSDVYAKIVQPSLLKLLNLFSQ